MTIKVGVIGLGQMGHYHAEIYEKLPLVELAGVCERDDQKRQEAQEKFGCTAYKDFEEILSNPEIDAVSIVLPDNLHRECVEFAVANNKHILLEKPLAKTLEDGEALYKITKDYDKVFTVGFLLRFDPRFNMVKQALDNDELGDIIHLYCRRNSPIIGPKRYIGASDLSMHVMIHDIDYINWYMGCEPVKVFAKGRSVLLKEHDMKDVIYAIVTYENGAIACLEACWVLPENSPTSIDDKLELVGTKGVTYIDSSDNGVRFVTNEKITYPDSRHWYYTNGQVSGDLFEELMAFVNNIQNGTKSVITPKEAYDSLRVVDAIERSMAEGKEVDM
ncbi:gfo/Idh/MocA family oxidoreductase [Gracilibacillus salitolerans]|uniref:Gfo/Idh/MocA family oxidoreductase n=1 Tax=Gracilibacillus salitolerans TaxID=2663022 RepID=A0A5Q2TMQ0_9BACI|nr:Gfo/Idh/MocA family oxidoreductase [Gracilibacillus salitolerans]QGH36229.1 gfo/Idh/MocA family oxidoreductase [Gracilibacillus salitolerans]